MFNIIAFFWAVSLVGIVNVIRCLSSLRVLLSILRQSDPMLYQSVDGNGFFTIHGQFNKHIRLVCYINSQGYLTHHDANVIFICERLRKQFLLTGMLCGAVVLCLIAMAI
ncbi:universal stress protein UspB [Xenorhabdus bovienii]|uniref:universal stress protein UspB n=1 Tax=Xenorhabdus bovienii TaxID=40576 RepID=UPI003DA412D9